MPRGISSFPLFYTRPQLHHSCCRCRKQCSSERLGRGVWSCNRRVSNSGPGTGILETWKILTNTLAISKSALCAQSAMILRDISGRGRVGGGLLGGGLYKAERARSVPSPVWFGPSKEPAGLIRTWWEAGWHETCTRMHTSTNVVWSVAWCPWKTHTEGDFFSPLVFFNFFVSYWVCCGLWAGRVCNVGKHDH